MMGLSERARAEYDHLFGDGDAMWLAAADPPRLADPTEWSVLRAAADDILENRHLRARRALLSLVADGSGKRSISQIAAWTLLRLLEEVPGRESSRTVLGVVAEFGTIDGPRVLAGYRDGTACCLHAGGSNVFVHAPEPLLRDAVAGLLQSAEWLSQASPPLRTIRPGVPNRGVGRLTALTAAGQHVVVAPLPELRADSRTGECCDRANVIIDRLEKG
jgi:hypothetical protein